MVKQAVFQWLDFCWTQNVLDHLISLVPLFFLCMCTDIVVSNSSNCSLLWPINNQQTYMTLYWYYSWIALFSFIMLYISIYIFCMLLLTGTGLHQSDSKGQTKTPKGSMCISSRDSGVRTRRYLERTDENVLINARRAATFGFPVDVYLKRIIK